MKYSIIILFLGFLMTQKAEAQFASLDKVKEEVANQPDTLKAIYDWITTNISYDVKKLEMIKEGKKPLSGNFRTQEEYQTAQLKKLLGTKRGVCEDYSLLFHTLAESFGYTSAVVTGYNKDIKGRVKNRVGHAWNAVLVNGNWRLYESTWGAGYLKEDKFVRSKSDKWYDVSPSTMIKDHLPYDPIWQILTQPVSYDEFKDGKTTGATLQDYDYAALIQDHLKSDKKTQINNTIDRSAISGTHTTLYKKWKRHQLKNISSEKQLDQIGDLNALTDRMKVNYDKFNTYSKAKSQRFKKKDYDAAKGLKTLQEIKLDVEDVTSTLSNMKLEYKGNNKQKRKTINSNKKFLRMIKKEIKFMESL